MSSGSLPPEAMREILPEFMQESLGWMAQAEAALLELENDAANAEAVNVVLRAFHTVKGTSAFLGLDAISGLAHDAESLLIPVRDTSTPFTRTHADLLLSAIDAARTLLDQAHEEVMNDAPPGQSDAYETLRARMREMAEAEASPAAQATDGDHGSASDRAVDHAHARHGDDGWTRIRTQRLDQLLDLVSELAVAQSMVAQDETVVRERHGPLATKVLQTTKIVRELQALGLSLRMVPLRALFQRMQRLVRELSHQSGKDVTLVTEGADTEIDRRMAEVLTDPLVHMVRNAIDHGIETADERTARGKPARATLRLTARHAAGTVVIEIGDDGKGLDRDRILATARERGLVTDGSTLSDADVWRLIFEPGLSTSDAVTDLSGRGVGMDVVLQSVESLRGRIDIVSTAGEGTTFTIRLPLTTAITDGLLVRVGTERYILPSLGVVTSFRPEPGAVVAAAHAGGGSASRGELIMVHGLPVPIVRLHEELGAAGAETDPCRAVLVIVEDHDDRLALLVDELLGQQQYVVKPLAEGMRVPPAIAGSAVLGDGRIGLILDPAGLRGLTPAGNGPSLTNRVP